MSSACKTSTGNFNESDLGHKYDEDRQNIDNKYCFEPPTYATATEKMRVQVKLTENFDHNNYACPNINDTAARYTIPDNSVIVDKVHENSQISLSATNQVKKIVVRSKSSKIIGECAERPYKCDKCSASFIQLIEYNEHIRKHSDGGPFACANCNVTYLYKNHFKNHEAKCNSKTIPCQKLPPVGTLLKPMKFSKLPSKDGKIKLPEVKKGLFKNKDFTVFQSVKKDTSNTAVVDEKNLSFKKYKRIEHYRPFVCSDCDASYMSKDELVNHRTKHTNADSFICNKCNIIFMYRKLYETHKRKCDKKLDFLHNHSLNCEQSSKAPKVSTEVKKAEKFISKNVALPQKIQAVTDHNFAPSSDTAEIILPSGFQIQNLSNSTSVIEIRQQDLQEMNFPHGAIFEQVLVSPQVQNLSKSDQQIKYDIMPMPANYVDISNGINIGQIVNVANMQKLPDKDNSLPTTS